MHIIPIFLFIFASDFNNSFKFLMYMINKSILMVFLNHLDSIGAKDIKCSSNKLEFCAPISNDMEIYNIFGFCIDRVFSYPLTHNLNYYAIQ